jgi:hypothetical protein
MFNIEHISRKSAHGLTATLRTPSRRSPKILYPCPILIEWDCVREQRSEICEVQRSATVLVVVA